MRKKIEAQKSQGEKTQFLLWLYFGFLRNKITEALSLKDIITY